MLARAIVIAGSATAVSIWVYEIWRWGITTWQALPFHQLLSWLHLLPRNLYIWSYCSTQSPEARAAVAFCADVSAQRSELGKIVWLYLGTEAGVIVVLTTVALATVASMFQRAPRTFSDPSRRQAWPEPVAPQPALRLPIDSEADSDPER